MCVCVCAGVSLCFRFTNCSGPSQAHCLDGCAEATFHIPQGNLVVLSGNRGSGKKTALELIAGDDVWSGAPEFVVRITVG